MLNGNYGLILLYLSLFFLYRLICIYELIVLFQYTISGDREQVFLWYYKDFFEQICSDVQFFSPPEGRHWKTVFSYYIQCLKVDWCTLFCANLYAKRTFSVAFYRWWDELHIRACLLKFIKNRKNTCSDTINIL